MNQTSSGGDARELTVAFLISKFLMEVKGAIREARNASYLLSPVRTLAYSPFDYDGLFAMNTDIIVQLYIMPQEHWDNEQIHIIDAID